MVKLNLTRMNFINHVICMLLYKNHLRSHVVKQVCGYFIGRQLVPWSTTESGEILLPQSQIALPSKLVDRFINIHTDAWLIWYFVEI